MTKITDERLAEMLAGLEGVTPGPWAVDAGKQESLAIRAGTMQIAMIPGYGQGKRQRVATHIARCDPDTMRSILTELQSLRAQGGVCGQVAFNAVLSCPHEIDHDRVVLKVDHSEAGNALAQLHARLSSLEASPAPVSEHSAVTKARDIGRGLPAALAAKGGQ